MQGINAGTSILNNDIEETLHDSSVEVGTDTSTSEVSDSTVISGSTTSSSSEVSSLSSTESVSGVSPTQSSVVGGIKADDKSANDKPVANKSTNSNSTTDKSTNSNPTASTVNSSGVHTGDSLYDNDASLSEYDDLFSGDEKLEHKLIAIKSEVKTHISKIDIDDIVTSDFKRISRDKTVSGLSSAIAKWGIVTPIHVLKLEDGGFYLLLDGLRRVYAALRSGEKQINAVIWEFSDIDEGKSSAEVLSLMINRTQQYSNRETWEIMDRLLKKNVSAGLIEYLLQLNAGDGMKLQDIMTVRFCDFDETRQKFLADELTIDATYKKLTTLRKKIDKLERDDKTVIVQTEDNEGIDKNEDSNATNSMLSEDEVRDLLEMSTSGAGGIDEQDISALDRSAEASAPEVQDKNNRHPVDPSIKQAVFCRDKFRCQCCGLGDEANLGVLVFHHIVGVACGGEDSVNNGLTLCQNCHMLLHLYVFGRVHVDFTKLDENEVKKFKHIFYYGNVQIDAWKRAGKSKDEAYKADAGSRRHLYPGEGLDDVEKAYAHRSKE